MSIVTAVSTGTVAGITVLGLIIQDVRWAVSKRQAKRFERFPRTRIEVVNVSIKQYIDREATLGIFVRNRSHLPIDLLVPRFEIRGIPCEFVSDPPKIT